MDDTAKKVALVAEAIERVVRQSLNDDEPGLFEEAARQAIAAYLNAWRTTESVYPARTRSPDGRLHREESDSPSPTGPPTAQT